METIITIETFAIAKSNQSRPRWLSGAEASHTEKLTPRWLSGAEASHTEQLTPRWLSGAEASHTEQPITPLAERSRSQPHRATHPLQPPFSSAKIYTISIAI